MTRQHHTGQQNLCYWVDGHCISAYSEADALAEVRHLYGYEAEEVRPWTDEDQAELGRQVG